MKIVSTVKWLAWNKAEEIDVTNEATFPCELSVAHGSKNDINKKHCPGSVAKNWK